MSWLPEPTNNYAKDIDYKYFLLKKLLGGGSGTCKYTHEIPFHFTSPPQRECHTACLKLHVAA